MENGFERSLEKRSSMVLLLPRPPLGSGVEMEMRRIGFRIDEGRKIKSVFGHIDFLQPVGCPDGDFRMDPYN